MTARELIAIVCDVPREALGGLRWTFGTENAMFFVDGVAGFLPLSIAEHAFIGSMKAWLVERGQYPTSSKCGAGDEMRYIVLGFGNKSAKGVGTSLVAALAAACKEAA